MMENGGRKFVQNAGLLVSRRFSEKIMLARYEQIYQSFL